MNEKLLKVLEFDEILRRLSAYAVSEPTKKQILNLKPCTDLESVRQSLSLTEEAYTVKYKYLLSPISQFDDIKEIIDKAKAGAVLRPSELMKVANVLRAGRIAKSEIAPLGDDVQGLKQLVAPIILDRNLENRIGDAVAGENELKDDASEKLADLRRKIHACNAKLKEKLAGYTRTSNISKYLQDNIVTVRMGRFVLPVKSECRSMIPGLIHDQSSSGSTVFIEPFPVVELNNELRYLQMEEQREIERILSVLSGYVANAYDILYFIMHKCTELDEIFAKSAYAVDFKGIIPKLGNNGVTSLISARHPLIDSTKIVPVSVQIGENYDILVITGPNTGGKTVCLKTVGLCCLMAYCGIPIPCEKESTVSVYDNIFCDLGDEQSIEQSLSTFSAHIVNVVGITDSITPQSLVLLDELGAGTDPVEGAALSVGIVKYLELIGCKGIVTTHFNELKEYALLSKKLMNACMQFDEETLSPTYKLMVGIPGVSNALKIAGTYGLNDYILTKAQESISEEQTRFENVLRQAQYAKMQVEREKEQLEALKNELSEERLRVEDARKKIEEKQERLQRNAKAETNRIISGMVSQADDLIEELKETIKAGDEEALRKARLLKGKLSALEDTFDEDIMPLYPSFVPNDAKIGQTVIVRSLNSEGKLLSLADKKGLYRVRAGNIVLAVKADDLAKPIIAEKTAPKQKHIPDKSTLDAPVEVAHAEIKVLGLTVAEAIEELEPLLLSSVSGTVIRIVHGKGTGALGKGIQAYLSKKSNVASFRYGRYGEGDTGVTIAEIK